MPASASGVPTAPSIASEPVDLSSTPYSLARAVHARRSEYVRQHRTRVKIGTWNVAGFPGTDKDLASWFLDGEGLERNLVSLDLSENAAVHSAGNDAGADRHEDVRLVGGEKVGLYVLGLQEVVDLNMTKEYMARAVYTDNTAREKWQAALDAAVPSGYKLVVAEQSFGLVILIYASPEVASMIGNVSTKQVGTGMGGWFANKGAIATRLVLGETTRMVFVNCHLASGTTPANLDKRCTDVSQILQRAQFDPITIAGVSEDNGEKIGQEDFGFWFGDLNFRLDGLPGDDIRRLLTLHTRGEYGVSGNEPPKPLDGNGVIVMRNSESDDDATTTASSVYSREEQDSDSESSLPDPDEFPEDPSQDPTSLQATLDSLLPHDQLRKVIKERKAFHEGWREGPITFLPSYKYDVGTVGLFDSSEKKRAPSWCDRILYRTRNDKDEFERQSQEQKAAKEKDEEMKSIGIDQDDDVLFSYDPETDGEDSSGAEGGFEYDEYDENEDTEPERVVTKEGSLDSIKLDLYCSHQRITSSDHKPITAIFTIDYDAVVTELRAKVHAEVARQLDRAENEGRPVITIIAEGGQGFGEATVELSDVQFLERKSSSLTIANTGGAPATFSFVEKPAGSEEHKEEGNPVASDWLTTTFRRAGTDEDDTDEPTLGEKVTLDPGETVTAVVSIQVTSTSLVRALNDGQASLEDVLVLRVDDGRDHFIPVKGKWLPSCFGRSVEELIRVPDGGIRRFVAEWKIEGSIPYDAERKFSAPKELFKITAAMETLTERCVADEAMLEDVTIPKDLGWPLDENTWTAPAATREALAVVLVSALDNDKLLIESLPLETPSIYKLEAMSFVLMRFLSSLTDGLISYQIWLKLGASLPNLTGTAGPDTKTQILDVLSSAPNHNVAFVFLTSSLSRVAAELCPAAPASQPPQRRLSFRRPAGGAAAAEAEVAKKRRGRERRFAELVAPVVCRTGGTEKDKATREQEKALLDICIKREDGS